MAQGAVDVVHGQRILGGPLEARHAARLELGFSRARLPRALLQSNQVLNIRICRPLNGHAHGSSCRDNGALRKAAKSSLYYTVLSLLWVPWLLSGAWPRSPARCK